MWNHFIFYEPYPYSYSKCSLMRHKWIALPINKSAIDLVCNILDFILFLPTNTNLTIKKQFHNLRLGSYLKLNPSADHDHSERDAGVALLILDQGNNETMHQIAAASRLTRISEFCSDLEQNNGPCCSSYINKSVCLAAWYHCIPLCTIQVHHPRTFSTLEFYFVTCTH